MNKHYIRLNENDYVIKVFSDTFEQPISGDICVNENGSRHFNLELYNQYQEYKYQYVDGELIEQTEPTIDYIRKDLSVSCENYYDSNEVRDITVTKSDVDPILINIQSKMRGLIQEQITAQTSEYIYFDETTDQNITVNLKEMQIILSSIMAITNANYHVYAQHLKNIAITNDSSYNVEENFLINQIIAL